MDRDQTIQQLQGFKARLPGLPYAAFDIDEFLTAKRREMESWDDAKHTAERDASLARKAERQKQERLDTMIIERFSEHRAWVQARIGDLMRELANNLPPVLAAAISRMEEQVKARQRYGVREFSFAQHPGATLHQSSKGRTAGDEAATLRAEQALDKLRALSHVPQAELVERINGVWTWLTEGDNAAAFIPPPATVTVSLDARMVPPPYAAQGINDMFSHVIAEIETEPLAGIG